MRFYFKSDSELKGGGGGRETSGNEFKVVKHILTKVVIELIHPLAQFCGSYIHLIMFRTYT